MMRAIKVITEANGLVRFKDAETGEDLLGLRVTLDEARSPCGRLGTLSRVDEETGAEVQERVRVTEIVTEYRP